MEAGKGSFGRIENLEYQIEGLIVESRDREFTEYLKKLKDRLYASKYQVDLLQEELDANCKRYEERIQMWTQAQEAQQVQEAQQIQQGQVQEPQQMQQGQMQESQQMPVQVPSQSMQSQAQAPQNVRKPIKKDNLEFIIGATIFGVIGAAFILTDLVLLGMNYTNGFVKGIGLCVICIAVLAFSELVVYRRLPKLGYVLSAIGIGGLYLSVVINFLVLHNFNLWATLIVTMVITVMVVLLSRKRDSLVYRIIGMIAGYLCFFTIQKGITNVEFLVVSGMVFLMSVLCIALPLRKRYTAINCIHMCINAIFTLAFLGRAKYCGVTELNFVFIFLASATVVMHLLLAVQVLYQKRCAQADSGKKSETDVLILVFYGISAYILSLRVAFLMGDIYRGIARATTEGEAGRIILAACMAAIILAVIGILTFIVLAIKKCPERWAICYYLNFVIWVIFAGTGRPLIRYEYEYLPGQIALVVLLLISKLCCLKKIRELKVSDAILTTYICLYIVSSAMAGDAYEVILLVGGVLLSILLLSQWKTYQEVVLTLALAVFAYQVIPSQLRLPAVAGLFFVGILLFNNVKRWKDEKIFVYNIFMLIGQAYCFLILYNPVYQGAYLTYLCMLIFGLATIIVTFNDKYQMDFKGKNMILAIFLSYMSFAFRTGENIVNSILLMVVALICVGIGFAKNQKAVRIYGLTLSLLVCAKIGVYDFVEASTLQKTILFFIVGVIALIIAGIYIILEKKRSDAENKRQNNFVWQEAPAEAGTFIEPEQPIEQEQSIEPERFIGQEQSMGQ